MPRIASSDLLLQVVLFTMIPVAATVIGGLVAAYRSPGRTLTSYVQHFAAGVVLAAVAGELLPEVVESGRFLFAVILGFVLGLASMLGVKLLSAGIGRSGGSTSLVATTGVDVFVDGLVIGIGFVAGGGAGALLVLVLTVEILFLGLSVAASLSESGASPGRVIGTTSGLALLVVVGAAASVTVLRGRRDGGLGVRVGGALVLGDRGVARRGGRGRGDCLGRRDPLRGFLAHARDRAVALK